ncbi:hypothetical protein DPMN_058204 [Dreissena polymorpha]|uniref:Uncharacterized protein n=1 Tax=Dreissena polymorpha TaxID=45954 RepID=A0A9D4C1A6_DREPO|nr:hypothetical protein DPMN_058204 [Dreissena polymorpha]
MSFFPHGNCKLLGENECHVTRAQKLITDFLTVADRSLENGTQATVPVDDGIKVYVSNFGGTQLVFVCLLRLERCDSLAPHHVLKCLFFQEAWHISV